MTYVEELTIGSGVVSEFLKAGPEEQGGDAGTIIIENGGKLVSGELLQGGSVTVSGTAEELTVNSGGTLRISGGVVSGGKLVGGSGNDQTFVVGQGGSAVNIEISATRLHISNGGVGIGNTVAVAGVAQLVRGEASHTLVLKGYERVYTGASTYMTIVNGGQQHVNEGGVTVSTIILAQQQNVSNGGVAKSTVIRDGFQSVEDGGTAEGTVVSGGYQFVKGGGSAKDTVVSDGYATVDDGGRLTGAIVSGGSFNLKDGGVAQNVSAVNGGMVNVSSGGELTGLTVLSGASVGISGGGTVNDLYLSGLSDTTSARAGISGTVNGMEVHSGGNVALMGTANNVLINSGAVIRILNRNAKLSVEYNPFVGETKADYTTPVLISSNAQGASATVTFQTGDERTFHVYYGADDGKQGLVSRAIVMNDLEVEAGKSALVFSGGRLENAVIDDGGKAYVSGGAILSGVTLLAGGSLYAGDGGVTMYDLSIVGPTTGRLALGANIAGTGNTIYGLYVSNNVNGSIYGATVSGGSITGSASAAISDNWQFKVLGGRLYDYTITTYGDNVINNATWLALSSSTASGGLGSSYASNVTVEKNARFQVSKCTADDVKVVEGGYLYIQAQGKINDLYVSGYYAPAASTARAVNAAGTVTGAEIHSGGVLSNGNTANNILVNLGGVLSMTAAAAKATVDFNPWTGTIDNTIGATVTYNTRDKGVYYGIDDGRTGLVSRTDALADLTVESGYSALIYDGGALTDATVRAGGQLIVDDAAAAGITGKLTLSLDGATGTATAFVNDNFGAIAAAVVVEVGDGTGDYTLIGANADGDENIAVDLGNGNVYATNAALTTVIDAFTGRGAARSLEAGSLKLSASTEAHTIAAVDMAAALATSGSTLNGGDREARWTANTTYGDTVYAAQGMTTGNAWLEIDGATVGTALYGAAANQNFTGVVNMKLTSGSIRNLAAGAANGGSVKAVNFTMAGGELAGAAYAGGFGNVTGSIKTTISNGTLAEGKDFYAGALANYKNTGTATSVGDISLTIAGGTFGGNIYGASAVKASVANAHTAGNVTLSITGGETAKGDQACIFAGGYATGSATEAKVYTVGNIDATISGGSWGEAGNGRGFFGGAFASGVTAEAGGVTITIEGGSVGNVFGGGWAQKGGTSIVDDVEINITGGSVTNVFGGGTHSTTGGATTVDDVTITVSGGNITGAIYAGGQSVNDNVTGSEISVNFTGDTNFACGVYGYSYGGGTIGDATLSYSSYTGTFSGAVGGFVGITLDGDTAMTLGTAAADVSNGAWNFDFTDRADTLSATSFLTWSDADFANDTVKVNFADATQAASGWSIATAAFDATTTFDLYIGGTEIANVAYDTAIADGDWAGWKFTDENGTLKFKQLA